MFVFYVTFSIKELHLPTDVWLLLVGVYILYANVEMCENDHFSIPVIRLTSLRNMGMVFIKIYHDHWIA